MSIAVLLAFAVQARDRPEAPTGPTLSVIHPVIHLQGKTADTQRSSDVDLDFERDLGMDPRFAFDLTFSLGGKGPGMALFNLAGFWFGGEGPPLAAPKNYGGETYPAGSIIRSEGSWLWAEFSYGYLYFAPDESIRAYAGFSLGFNFVEVVQTRESIDELIYVFMGFRGQVVYRPFPALSMGLDVGGWVGARDEPLAVTAVVAALVGGVGALATPVAAAAVEPSYAWLASAWVAVDVHPNVSVRAGYYLRGQIGTQFKSGFDGEGIDLHFSGPMFSIEIRF